MFILHLSSEHLKATFTHLDLTKSAILSCIHSFNKYLMSTYHVPGPIPVLGI